ncbi:MAG: O-antigen ligase family protein [Candidatus Gracilibacteria bacterium]|nr:O-antigen ligase family protein [Candidatus Gracilibacteria bacterium]
MKRFIVYYFCLLFLIVSLINSKILNMFGVDFSYDLRGSFEFLKVMVFNIINSIFLIIYFIYNFKNKLNYNKSLNLIFFLFIISIATSSFFLTNIFGNNIKGHGLIFYTNLVGLFIVLINLEEDTKKTILKYILYLSIIPILLSIKEYFFSSINYIDLENRAFGNFGHPNFLAFFILIFLPIILKNIDKKVNIFLFIIFSFALFLSKSILGMILYFLYIIFYIKNYLKPIYFYILNLFIFIFVIYYIIDFGIITKLNSFISRFYIWESSLNIYFSNIKYIFFGIGNDSLQYVFDNFKSPYLYIFENIGFTADRTHNYYLQILINYGLIGFSLFVYFIIKLFKNSKKNYLFHSIILSSTFLFFNFPSIINYLLVIIILSIILKQKIINKKIVGLKLFFIIFSIFSIISSIIYLKEENNLQENIENKSEIQLYNNLKNEDIEYKILNSEKSYKNMCFELTREIKTAENYFFCGELLKNLDYHTSILYYSIGLGKLPDMRNKDSKYYDNFLVRKLYNENRFFSEKYSDLKNILNKIENK